MEIDYRTHPSEDSASYGAPMRNSHDTVYHHYDRRWNNQYDQSYPNNPTDLGQQYQSNDRYLVEGMQLEGCLYYTMLT
jgi:hypothetical protein